MSGGERPIAEILGGDVELRQLAVRIVPIDHPLRDRFSDMDLYEIRIEYRDTNRWAVMYHGRAWTTRGWEWEPIPSSRTVTFKRRARFSLDKAVTIARERAAEELAHLEAKCGMAAVRVVAGLREPGLSSAPAEDPAR